MLVEGSLHKPLFVQICSGDPVKTVPFQSHASGQFQHILTVDFSHIRYPSVIYCRTPEGRAAILPYFLLWKIIAYFPRKDNAFYSLLVLSIASETCPSLSFSALGRVDCGEVVSRLCVSSRSENKKRQLIVC